MIEQRRNDLDSIKKNLDEVNRSLNQMEVSWDSMGVMKKESLRSEIEEFRSKRESIRQNYFDLEKSIEAEVRTVQTNPAVSLKTVVTQSIMPSNRPERW